MSVIYHITRREYWRSATGPYQGDTLESQGFIHASTAAQVLRVANSIFRGQSGLLLLVIDAERVTADVRFEPPIDPHTGQPETGTDECFPHIYGPLNRDAVIRALDFQSEADGLFSLPFALLDVLAAPDRHNRIALLHSLVEARAIDLLVGGLAHADTNVRWQSAVALGWIGDPRAIEPLAAAVPGADDELRANIAWSLGQIGDAHAVEPLAQMALAQDDSDPYPRHKAALALARLGALDRLHHALSSGFEPVQRTARAALATTS